MEGGKVVEKGTHKQLMSAKGKYWNYVELQNLYQVDDARTDISQVKGMDLEFEENIPDLPDNNNICSLFENTILNILLV